MFFYTTQTGVLSNALQHSSYYAYWLRDWMRAGVEQATWETVLFAEAAPPAFPEYPSAFLRWIDRLDGRVEQPGLDSV